MSKAKLLKSVKIRPSKPNSPLGDLLSSVLSRQQAFLLHEHQVVALTGHLAQYNCCEIFLIPPCGTSSSWPSAPTDPPSPTCSLFSQGQGLVAPPPDVFFSSRWCNLEQNKAKEGLTLICPCVYIRDNTGSKRLTEALTLADFPTVFF